MSARQRWRIDAPRPSGVRVTGETRTPDLASRSSRHSTNTCPQPDGIRVGMAEIDT